MSRLFLVRHGNTKSNSAKQFCGQTDVGLSAEGRQQAERLCDRLATERIDAIYASNLSRASTTAEVIASRQPADIITCTELAEINFGLIEGLTFEEISQRYPKLAESLTKLNTKVQFPGGESIDQLNQRVHSFLARLERHAPEETILIVAHAGTLRLLICNLLGIKLEHWQQFRLDSASLSILETYPKRTILNLLNDVSHLQQKEIL